MNVTLRQISYFVAVAETGSISGAAATLGISQSAITESVRALEFQTGATLFERHSKGVALTYQGHQYLRHSRLILAAVADAGRALNARGDSVAGNLNLGVTSLVAGYFLADLLSRFRRVFPNITVRVVEEDRPFVEHLLVNGELHIALMLVSNLENRDALEFETLVRSRNRVWLPPDHHLMSREKITLPDLALEPLIALTIDEMGTAAQTLWQSMQRQPNIVLNTSSVEAVRSLVATGAGIAVLPDMVFRPWSLEGDRLEARAIEENVPTVDVGIAWRRGSPLPEPSNTFIALAREHRGR